MTEAQFRDWVNFLTECSEVLKREPPGMPAIPDGPNLNEPSESVISRK